MHQELWTPEKRPLTQEREGGVQKAAWRRCLFTEPSKMSGKASSVSPLSTMFPVRVFVDVQVEEGPLYSYFAENCYQERVLCFIECFFASVDIIV